MDAQVAPVQDQIDAKNAEFWNELCGSNLARSLDITELGPESLRRFDDEYLRVYPYLDHYVATEDLSGKRVLEIGLGYGTFGQVLASRGSHYYGLDIAKNPVALMRYRLSLLGQDHNDERIQQGSALSIPHKSGSFQYVYSIGCLHHTGDLPKAVSEVYRVLAPGGKAIVMLYNRYSIRQLLNGFSHVWTYLWRPSQCSHKIGFWDGMRARYDFNEQGEAAPRTDYVSRREVRRLFGSFARVQIETRNCDTLSFLGDRIVIPRTSLLNNLGRVWGLDLYIRARK